MGSSDINVGQTEEAEDLYFGGPRVLSNLRDSERRIAGVPDAHLPHERGVRRDLAEIYVLNVERYPRRSNAHRRNAYRQNDR